jgi:23S rRNA pseudouridine1911/1915/1917 synthase
MLMTASFERCETLDVENRLDRTGSRPLYRRLGASAIMARPPPTNLIVPEALAGERLDRAIAALAAEVSRGEARRLIAAGVVFVAGRRTGISSRPVRAGELISWESPARPRGPGQYGEPHIILERDDLWIIDKPAGMPIEPTRSGWDGTLSDWLRRAHGQPFVTHRLDAATSGLVVVARDRETQAALNRLFATHAIGRRYVAVVSPGPPWEQATLDTPVDGRPAITRARVVARSELAAALELTLETGRTRQIRRHLADAGVPVVGENAAGTRTNRRLLLHAFALRLPGTSTRGPLSATAVPPPDFASAALILGLATSDFPGVAG